MFTSLLREAPAAGAAQRADTAAACQRVEALVRQHFTLGPEDDVCVEQRPGTLPGCPPWETGIDFWPYAASGEAQRHHYKVFKPAAAVGNPDLPPPWMKPTLAVNATYGCDCC